MCNCCFIIPKSVLDRLARDAGLERDVRDAMARTALLDTEIRKLRIQNQNLTRIGMQLAPMLQGAVAAPAVQVYDCHHGLTLPGAPVPNPGSSPDATAKTSFVEATEVANFYSQIFGRNSVDGRGMALVSSVHYDMNFDNAFWNGVQMVYGDGDGQYFLDFTKSNDVIAHEFTHGVTQHTIQLAYKKNEAGGLNESLSDVFGSMFRQWRAKQTVGAADWLIGKGIIGPAAKALGVTCLRDMADPAAAHTFQTKLGQTQITHYTQFSAGMDPHMSSGVPNLAFYTSAKAIGGHSWDKAGQIWYRAMTAGKPSPNMKMKAFADRTRRAAAALYPGDAAIAKAVDQGWKKVGL
jgi:Zn-dependent metalloprotease